MKIRIPDSQGFPVTTQELESFTGRPSFYRVSGPASLVRLVQFAKTTYDGVELQPSKSEGKYWFEWDFFSRLTHHARHHLLQQQMQAGQPFSNPLGVLIGNYVRHVLRADLALCYDWTRDLDAYVRLDLGVKDTIVALVGQVAAQPAFSQEAPKDKSSHSGGVWLRGKATQYLIDFQFAPNRPYAARIPANPMHF